MVRRSGEQFANDTHTKPKQRRGEGMQNCRAPFPATPTQQKKKKKKALPTLLHRQKSTDPPSSSIHTSTPHTPLACAMFATSNRFPHANSSVLPGAPRQMCSQPPTPAPSPPVTPPPGWPSAREGGWLACVATSPAPFCGAATVSIAMNCPGMCFFMAYAPGCSSIRAKRAFHCGHERKRR